MAATFGQFPPNFRYSGALVLSGGISLDQECLHH